jgi:hypothetical protein
MQGPKKMAGGGIIAFNGEKDSEVPKDEEKATSSIGDFFRRLVEPPQFLKDRIERAKDISYAESQVPAPWEAVTPSERTRRKEETGRVLAGGKRPDESGSISPAVKADAKKPDGNLPIQNVPDPNSGIAALMKAAGSMGGGRGGGGGGGGGGELAKIAKQLADSSETETPEQQAYRTSALKRAQEFENYRSPAMSEAQREAFIDEKFRKNQEYSKPHFDMMQKLIDEEKAANNAGKESEFYQMLGKMGGALMSSRGAFGPALGRAVSEGIDYSDKMDAARAAAERLRRQAQMDLLKARMLDEKGDRQGALTELANHDRALKDAAKFDLDAKKASTEMLKDVAGSDTKRQMQQQRLASDFQIAGVRSDAAAQSAALRNQMGLMNLALRMQGMQDKNLPTQSENIQAEKLAREIFSDPSDPTVSKFIALTPGGKNILDSIKMGTMKPDSLQYKQALVKAKELFKQSLSQGTRTGGSGGTMGVDFLQSLGG